MFDQTGFANGKVQGTQKATGLRPGFMPKLVASGIELPESVFAK